MPLLLLCQPQQPKRSKVLKRRRFPQTQRKLNHLQLRRPTKPNLRHQLSWCQRIPNFNPRLEVEVKGDQTTLVRILQG
jgi:hypothetical protein